ncbi:MAG: hypothetical protein IKD70_10220 [Eggerthellaceae bacterium]|nr:hypothetical protein [Eggerthellaceae bacterium]
MRYQPLRLSDPDETWRATNVRLPSELYDEAVIAIRDNIIEGKRPDDMTSLIERALRSYLDQVKAERQSSASNFSLTDW